MNQQRDNSELIRKALQSVPLPSRAVRELLLISQESDVEMQRIVDTITSDEALTARVIRVVNSALFGMNRQVSSVQQATVLLGRQAIVQMAVGVAALHMETAVPADLPLSRQAFWRHSMSTAFLARHISAGWGEVDAEKAFTAGLLHDIGKLVLMGYLGPEYTYVLQHAQREQKPLDEVERAMLGVDHDHIGQELCDKWKLSASLREAASLHHPEGEPSALNRIVQAANAVAKATGVGESGNPHVHPSRVPAAGARQAARDLTFIRELPREVARIERAFRASGAQEVEEAAAEAIEATKGTVMVRIHDETVRALITIVLCGMGFTPHLLQADADGGEVKKPDLVGGITDGALPQASDATWLDLASWRQERRGGEDGPINLAELREWMDWEWSAPRTPKA